MIYTPKPVWSDGIHFVREASIKDRHPMRFVVKSHETTASTFSRHAPDLEAATEIARRATKMWLVNHHADAQHWTGPALPVASGSQDAPAEPQIELQPFSNTHFHCIAANPVAQVWQCVSREGERKIGGRRRKDGTPARARSITHDLGQCAVLLHREPQRDAEGSVIVYHSWITAAEAAQELYDNADEEDRLMWKEGDKRVHSTARVDVIFDPDINGVTKPFSLYLPEYRRPIYEDRTRPIMFGTPARIDASLNPQAALDAKQRRKKNREFNREPSFEERPLRFRTIYGAIEEAERRERMLKGQTVV